MPDLSDRTDRMSFIAGSGEMAGRIRDFDWSSHPFGPPEDWPQALRAALGICLHSAFPSSIYWGPELRLLYNDAWAPIPGARHPEALGRPAAEIWGEAWESLWPQLRRLLETGEGFFTENRMVALRRHGFEEETYWNTSFSAIRGEGGRIAGIFTCGYESTDAVIAQRRLRFTLSFSERLHNADSPESAMGTATALLGEHLQACHVGYGEATEGGALTLLHGWAAEGAPPAPPESSFVDFGAALADDLVAGKPVRIEDIERDGSAAGPGGAETFAALKARGGLFVPWRHGDHEAAAFYLLTAEPRRWTENDLLTLQEALETTRDTVAILRNEQRQALLMREIDHRAKNALAVVQAVVRLSQAESVDDFRRVIEGRIAALARAHELLAESRWNGLELRNLIERELRPFAGDDAASLHRLNLEGPELRLPPELAQTVALAIHELATNAAKYGALKGRGGVLDVTWRNDQEQRLVLDWRETSREPVAAPGGRSGFGSELLNKSVRRQLGGEIVFDWAADGLKCRLELPLTRITPCEPEAPRKETPPTPQAAAVQPRLLLAEDEPLVAMDLENRLAGFGYRVVASVDSVTAALEALESGLPDLALLDANLNGESSLPAAVELHRRGVPVVFMTGYDRIDRMPDDLAEVPTLSKPIIDSVLRKTLANLLPSA